MLPAARFRSVVLLAPFACHPGFDRRRSNLPRRLREDRRREDCGFAAPAPGVQPIQRQVECELEFAAPTGRHGLGSACIPRRLQRKRVLLQSMRSER